MTAIICQDTLHGVHLILWLKIIVQYIFDKVGGDVRATMTYEDEFRNYIGKSEFWIEDGQVISI